MEVVAVLCVLCVSAVNPQSSSAACSQAGNSHTGGELPQRGTESIFAAARR
jgi:hypothetical protein